MKQRFWITNAIMLGAWEATAVATRRRVPTISATVHTAQRKHPWTVFLGVTTWSVALWRYLVLGRFAQ